MATKTVNLNREMQKRFETLHVMRNCVTLYHGAMGTGKTVSGVMQAYWMREFFDLPVIQVGTSVGLQESFGPFTFLSEEKFVEQLILIAKIASFIAEQETMTQDEVERYIQWNRETQGLKLYRSILLVDEFQKLCPARSPSGRLNKAVLNFIAQMRHYHCTLIGMTPNPLDVDRQVRQQIRWLCKPDFNPYTKWYKLRLGGSWGRRRMSFYAPHFYNMYDSWAFSGFNVKSLEKVLEKDV